MKQTTFITFRFIIQKKYWEILFDKLALKNWKKGKEFCPGSACSKPQCVPVLRDLYGSKKIHLFHLFTLLDKDTSKWITYLVYTFLKIICNLRTNTFLQTLRSIVAMQYLVQFHTTEKVGCKCWSLLYKIILDWLGFAHDI